MSLTSKIQEAKERYTITHNGKNPDLLILQEKNKREIEKMIGNSDQVFMHGGKIIYQGMKVFFYEYVPKEVLVAKSWTNEEFKNKIRNEVRP